jgi:hypothetical protein
MLGIALAATIAIVLVIIAKSACSAIKRYDMYLEGLWSGDPGYLESAQLSDFQLYIGALKQGKRQGYIIMTDHTGTFVANQAIEIEESRPNSRWWPALKNSFKTQHDAYTMCKVHFTYDGDAPPPMPTTMKLTLSILDGTLTLYDGDKIYAFLEKDIAASTAAAEIADATPAPPQ